MDRTNGTCDVTRRPAAQLREDVNENLIQDLHDQNDCKKKSDWFTSSHVTSSLKESPYLQPNLKMIVKVGSDPVPCDLDRIQEMFPTDNLFLFDKDPMSPRSKALTRKRSTTASRLQRALSGKNKIVPTEKSGNIADVIYSDTEVPKSQSCLRNYIMDTAVQLTSGVQSQERHLFLFSDVMVIAKIRTSGNYKLKEKVRVAEMWLSNCVEVVCEVAKSGEASFVMGWPTTNVVATFSSTHTRDLWLAKLKQLIVEQQQFGTSSSTSIRVHYWDPITKEECAQNVSVSQKDTVSICIASALKKLDINPNEADSYQLWVKVDRDSAPYPLIGHESPFAIKMNCLYVALAAAGEDAFESSSRDNRSKTLGSSNCPVLKCYFILRNSKRGSFDLVTPKKGKRVRKSPILQKVFRRSLSKPESLDKTDDSDCLFGQSLTRLTRDRTLPKPIMDILTALYEKGPYTMGIFRKSANARACRELREKLNDGGTVAGVDCVDGGGGDLGDTSILVLAAILKEFLRCLPDCLLLCSFYDDWLALPRLPTEALKVQEARSLLDKLPPAHVLFLKYFLCVLWHVHRRSSENMMTANNLAVCVGPSLLWSKSDCQNPSLAAQSEASKLVPVVVEFLILRCSAILGDECQSMFALTKTTSANSSPGRDLSRQDSGNEESDSLHSSGGLRRDDSSIDSLEHALLGVDGETSPKLPSKTKMSLTNLSRDSGLTMSDTQLYTPDEEVDSEASSGGRIIGVADRSNLKLTMSLSNNLKYCGESNLQSSCDNNWKVVVGNGSSSSSNNNNGGGPMQLQQSSSSTPLKSSSQSSSGASSNSSGYRSGNYDNHAYCCPSKTTMKMAVTQTQSLVVTSSSDAIRLKVDAPEPIYGSRSNCCALQSSSSSQFPLGDRKEVIKRRLSRPRAWARPVSSYGPEATTSFSNSSSSSSSAQPAHVQQTLKKSASEESLLSSYNLYSTLKRPPIVHHTAEVVIQGRPPPSSMSLGTMTMSRHQLIPRRPTNYDIYATPRSDSGCTMVRSKSTHQFCKEDVLDDGGGGGAHQYSRMRLTTTTNAMVATNSLGRQAAMQWHHSRSTPHIEKTVELSYDSSTISDNDSTPHISRSNSRGKDFTSLLMTGSSSTSSACASTAASNYDTYSSLTSHPYNDEHNHHHHRTQSAVTNDVALPKDPNNNVRLVDKLSVGTTRTPVTTATTMINNRESLNAYNVGSAASKVLDNEIHRAAPARVENSDEELEPAPPLPPKPVRSGTNAQHWTAIEQRSSADYQADEVDWHESGVFGRCLRTNSPAAQPLPAAAAKTTIISGKRVFTATQSNYDVPQWRTSRTILMDVNATTINNNINNNNNNNNNRVESTCASRTCSRGRSATPRLPLKGSQLRAKSQPPPEDRLRRSPETIYDCPRPPQWQKGGESTSSTTLGRRSAMSASQILKKTATVEDRLSRHGATVGRAFKKELSWSVSQLRSLFSRNNKDPSSSSGSTPSNQMGQTDHSDVSAVHRMWAASSNNAADDKLPTVAPPPPYRAPPKVLSERKNIANVASRTWTSRNFIKSAPSKSAVDSQDSASGGEESYV